MHKEKGRQLPLSIKTCSVEILLSALWPFSNFYREVVKVINVTYIQTLLLFIQHSNLTEIQE